MKDTPIPGGKRKRFKVRRGNRHLTIYPYGRNWRFGWKDPRDGRWRYATRATKAEIEEAAWELLGEMEDGSLVWTALDAKTRAFLTEVHSLVKPSDYEAVRSFLLSRQRSAEIVESVKRYIAFKQAEKNGRTRHLENVRRILEDFARAFAGSSVSDIPAEGLRKWWEDRTARMSDKGRNDVRGNLVAFWSWAIRDGIYPKDVTPAEKLPRATIGLAERRVLTPEEFLAMARHVNYEWRVWIVLGAFCGLRPEEISPASSGTVSRKDKRGLRAEEIDWEFGVIRVPAEVSKVGAPRIVPLGETAQAWLRWAGIEEGQTGPVCTRHPAKAGETTRLAGLVFGGKWPKDALRHSYGSYRNAVIRNLPQVAEEMGTSEAMLRRHYHNPQPRQEGEAWFALRPTDIRKNPISRGVKKRGDDQFPPRKAEKISEKTA